MLLVGIKQIFLQCVIIPPLEITQKIKCTFSGPPRLSGSELRDSVLGICILNNLPHTILIHDYLCLKTTEPGISWTIKSSQYNIINHLYFNFFYTSIFKII